MDCPSCRQDLSRFEYLYRFCPLCNAPLPEVTGAAGEAGRGGNSPLERAIPRDMVRNLPEGSPEGDETPLFDVYWKDEPYKAGVSNAIEISLVPVTELRDVSVKARLLSLGLVIERETLPSARKSTALHFYFKPETAGRHIARIAVICNDWGDNPTAFESEDFVFHVDEEEKEKESHTTYNIGDIISAGEVSLSVTRAVDRPVTREDDSQMVRLELTRNDVETGKIRRLALVDRMMSEGRRLFNEGSGLIESSRRPSGRNKGALGEAIGLLDKAKDRFLHVRREDPAHEESLRYMERIKDLMAGSGRRETPGAEEITGRFTSCVLRIPGEGGVKRVFLFSKETITVGRGESNDIAFPDGEYISEKHALIKVNSRCEFFIRDVGTEGKGSRNGTFLNAGESKITPQRDYPILDGTIINLGKTLGLFCLFLRGPGKDKADSNKPGEGAAMTGEGAADCFGMGKWGMVDAVKLKPGNGAIRDEYIILLREITLGAGNTNGLVIKGDHVSDIHMRIIYREGRYMVEDLNSPGGTFLNGFKLDHDAEYAIKEKGVLTVGDVEIGFEAH